MAKRVQKFSEMQEVEQQVMKGEDNLSQHINPLLVELILENVLSFLVVNNKSKSLGNYRLVCKFWDKEIIKLIRRETYIKLQKILAPYPEGFGWTAERNGNNFQYKVPYQQIRPFENVEVVLDSRWLKKDQYSLLENWFKVMGHQVNSLIYNCSLKTDIKKYCITLESILKEWCPNLKRLSITKKNSGCLFGLIFTSLFEHPSKQFICTKLTELSINIRLKETFSWPRPSLTPKFLVDPENFNCFIYNHGLPHEYSEFPEISNRAGVKVTVPKELYTNDELPEFSKYIPENFFPEYLDGGVLGQLMKNTSIKKLILGGEMDLSCQKQLIAFFHYRQNNWKASLNDLEIKWNVMNNFTKNLVSIGRLAFPIKVLKLSTKCQAFESSNDDLTRFIACFSNTLERLDININLGWQSGRIELPLLPKLKIFILNHHKTCKLSAANIVENAPNLEKCYVRDIVHEERASLNEFFEENSALSNERLKDFRLSANLAYFSGQQASKILEWFPKVKRLELTGMVDENIGLKGFFEKLGDSEVTDLKLGWCKKSERRTHDTVAEDIELIQEVGKLQNLRTLEMSFGDQNSTLRFFSSVITLRLMPIAFRDGFGKLPNLRFLKLTNIGVFMHEKEEVTKYIQHVPVVHMDYINSVMIKILPVLS